MKKSTDKDEQFTEFITTAMAEDIGRGDISALCCIDPHAVGKAELKIKEPGVLAGVQLAEAIFAFKDTEALVTLRMQDGDRMQAGDIAFLVEGRMHTILACERLVLNCMQRMSGIATLTNRYAEKIKEYPVQLLDTRKTTPNFRWAEKEAVRIGGGHNHRMGLFDMIMLKDNHIDYCGSIQRALEKADEYVKAHDPEIRIEVETRNLDEVKEALKTGIPDRIMLDNFSTAAIKEAVSITAGRCALEASGGITLGNIEEYAATGVDFISVGALIHQARSLDMSLKAII